MVRELTHLFAVVLYVYAQIGSDDSEGIEALRSGQRLVPAHVEHCEDVCVQLGTT